MSVRIGHAPRARDRHGSREIRFRVQRSRPPAPRGAGDQTAALASAGMRRAVADKIKDAIEASYWASPERPGLTHDELIDVLSRAGFQRGETEAALNLMRRGTLAMGRDGYVFDESELPIDLTSAGVGMTFAGDPRDLRTVAYVQTLLKERAQARGIDKPLAQASEIIAEGIEDGHDDHQLRLAIRYLDLLDLADIDPETRAIRGTHQTLDRNILPSKAELYRDSSRDDFATLLKHVISAIKQRSPHVRARALMAELASVPKIHLSGEEQRVLTDILSHFADTAESRSYDDLVRRFETLDLQDIIHARLSEKNLVHIGMDATFIPSLVAISQAPRLFLPLLVLLDDTLMTAKELWREKHTRPPLRGASGLIRVDRREQDPERRMAAAQLERLLEAISLRPCLHPAPPSAEIRDSIAKIDSAHKLMAHQLEQWKRGHERPERDALSEEAPVNTKIPRTKALELLRTTIATARSFGTSPDDDPAFERWRQETIDLLKNLFGKETQEYRRFAGIPFYNLSPRATPLDRQKDMAGGLRDAVACLEASTTTVTRFWPESELPSGPSPLEVALNICKRFPRAARRLLERHDNRAPFVVNDEYDVQCLMYTFLELHFDDIRPEEQTPSHAGASSRMDYLLKSERIVIETKMAKKDLRQKKIGDQLLLDIARYERHPDCDALVCYVHDPHHFVENPKGLATDVEGTSTRLKVRVVVGS